MKSNSDLAALVGGHPTLGRLLAFWNDSRDDRRFPNHDRIDAVALRDWLGHLILVEVQGPPLTFRYRVYGTTLATEFGRELTGRSTDALPPGPRATVEEEYGTVASSGSPLFVRHWRTSGRYDGYFAKLILPFGAEERTVTRLLCGVYRLPTPDPDAPSEAPMRILITPEQL